MNTEHHSDELAWEESVNQSYLRKAASNEHLAKESLDSAAAPVNTGWTGSGPKLPKAKGPLEPLIGRVALTSDVPDLGSGFYVGGGYSLLNGGITVVSWAAEAARLFFEGRDAQTRDPQSIDPLTVAARRSFKSSADELKDFEDECEPGVDSSTAFTRPERLAIAAPPARQRERRPASADTRMHQPPASKAKKSRSLREPASGASGLEHGQEASAPPPVNQERLDKPRETPTPRLWDTTDAADSSGPIKAPETRRAERLLLDALRAPKTGELAPVLATLQPEQYRLVTWPPKQNLVVQGHPGTGKTIVAAHRAAYLVLRKDDDGKSPRLHRVALVGPTDRWRKHIGPTVLRLASEGVEVLSLESLVRAWAGSSIRNLHPKKEREIHSTWAIGRVVDRAAGAEGRRLTHAVRVRELVNSLIQDTDVHRECLKHESTDLSDWLLEAGSIKQIRRDPSYLPFLAAAGIAAGGIGQHGGHQHVIVDEAQDLRPIEWWMLSKMFREASRARWSLLGDMNQRRSDFTWRTWEELADRLKLSGDDEESLLPEVLDSGYRSTREILDYAGALLPRGMRKHSALRRGPDPLVRRVGPKQVTDISLDEAERLTGRYSNGSVAVIAWDRDNVDRIERAFLKRGWRKDTDGEWLQRPPYSCRLSVVGPARARGLEFDAAVVVEPTDFKPNMGRHGELYTSLTRANHELVVVHSKAMPRELAGRGNRVSQLS